MSVDALDIIHKIVSKNAPKQIPIKHKRHNLHMIANKPYINPYGMNIYNTPYKQAACMLQDIIRLHPFVDGNKRTALLTAFTYLQANGFPIQMPKNADKFVLDIASNPNEEYLDRISEWLQSQHHDWKVD